MNVPPDAVDWSRLDEWLSLARAQRRVGPGCGYAEFERDDWRVQVTCRMQSGHRPGLVAAYRTWLAHGCITPRNDLASQRGEDRREP